MAAIKDVTLIDDGRSRLRGRNVGVYPLHRFAIRHPAEDSVKLPLALQITGWDEWVAGCERRRENSCLFAIEYVKEGRFEFVQEGRRRLVGPGGVFLVQRGLDSMMRTPDARALKRTMIVEGPCLQAVLTAFGLASTDVVEGAPTEELDALFERAETLFREARPGFLRRASAAVYETLSLLAEAQGRRCLPAPVLKALEIFESSFGERLKLGELASRCSCSPVTLQRLFRRSLGVTPMESFIGMKMELAKGMLEISSDPVKEIARRLGYSNQLYFSTEFRRRVGVSPRDWRREGRRP